MIAGKEKIILLKKSYTDVDEYNNPVESEIELEIDNVLVAHNSSAIDYDLFSAAAEIDITIYLNASYKDLIKNNDEFEYNGKRYKIVDSPILWETFKGSKIKPKLIIGLKNG